jgi:hypothetical protein
MFVDCICYFGLAGLLTLQVWIIAIGSENQTVRPIAKPREVSIVR